MSEPKTIESESVFDEVRMILKGAGKHLWRYKLRFAIVISVVIVVWPLFAFGFATAVDFFVKKWGVSFANAGSFGDTFGSLNTLVTGLAAFGAILALSVSKRQNIKLQEQHLLEKIKWNIENSPLIYVTASKSINGSCKNDSSNMLYDITYTIHNYGGIMLNVSIDDHAGIKFEFNDPQKPEICRKDETMSYRAIGRDNCDWGDASVPKLVNSVPRIIILAIRYTMSDGKTGSKTFKHDTGTGGVKLTRRSQRGRQPKGSF